MSSLMFMLEIRIWIRISADFYFNTFMKVCLFVKPGQEIYFEN